IAHIGLLIEKGRQQRRGRRLQPRRSGPWGMNLLMASVLDTIGAKQRIGRIRRIEMPICATLRAGAAPMHGVGYPTDGTDAWACAVASKGPSCSAPAASFAHSSPRAASGWI